MSMLAAVVMVRDEADILPCWLRHATALCDRILVVDHGSTDGTADILSAFTEAGFPIETWRMDEPGYWQSAVTTELARHAFETGADWVFPIDIDEFLNVAGRDQLRAILNDHREPIGFWRWRHAVLDKAAFEGGASCVSIPNLLANPGPAPPGRGKIVLHRSVAHKLPAFRLGAGNHRLHGMPFAKPIHGRTLGDLWHIPIRSRAQFVAKLRRDLRTHTDPSGQPLHELGEALRQKAALLDLLERPGARHDSLQQIALGYWEAGEIEDATRLANAVRVRPEIPFSGQSVQVAARVERAGRPARPAPPRQMAGNETFAAMARLDAGFVRIAPASFRERCSLSLEDALSRHFTLGFRLARFLASTVVSHRLGMPRKALD